MIEVAPLFADLYDDAAMFPPGNAPLDKAVLDHVRHLGGAHAGLVGPLVVPAKDLGALALVAADLPAASLELAVTVPLAGVSDALASAARVAAARLAAVEISLDDDDLPETIVSTLQAALGRRPEVTVFVEIPRDERREAVLHALEGTGWFAKFRTGGVRADLHPDENELAGAVLAAVRIGVPFKATAGLHHAVRNTDPGTGFEQHGFLNLLAATDAARDGAGTTAVVELLGERDRARLVERVREIDPRVRTTFRSLGTCSIAEPVAELADLGLIAHELTEDLA